MQRSTSIVTSVNSTPDALNGPVGEGDYYDESGWQHRLDTGDHALIPPDSDRAFYALLAVILIGGVALFGVSAYTLLR